MEIFNYHFQLSIYFEPLMRIELATSSLPRKCSTTELQRLAKKAKSGRRGSNPRPTAWKAVALPTELLPQFYKELQKLSVGRGGFEPPNSEEDRFTVCCRWPLDYLPVLPVHLNFHLMSRRRESNPRPTDYKSVALPTELLRLIF
jgi:hypothetical protein